MEDRSPASPELVGVTRRQLFNRTIVSLIGLGVTGVGTAAVALLWPRSGSSSTSARGPFGSKVAAGSVGVVVETIRETRAPVYVADGRCYLVEDEGDVVALYQKCTHLGCRVPFCNTSQWFECGCHASMYNGVGEWKAGPAPRGLDRFEVELEDGQVVVDTGHVTRGSPQGVDTTGQEPAGPHCVEP